VKARTPQSGQASKLARKCLRLHEPDPGTNTCVILGLGSWRQRLLSSGASLRRARGVTRPCASEQIAITIQVVGTRLAIQRENNHLVLQPITDEFIHSLRGCLKGKTSLVATHEREHRIEKDRTAR
jgi:hypothetical protein